MTDRPIIFSAPMVRALLDGRKTQTRRVLKPQPNMLNGGRPLNDGRGSYSVEGGWKRIPYAPGDRLWVREAFTEVPMIGPRYYATNDIPASFKKVSPIHMPRWASRLTLIVTDVRVQRLQEISDDDARAEGVLPDGFEGYRGHEGTIGYPTAIWAFRHILNSIHGPDAWDANPWVAAISFTVHRCNIDTMEEGTW